MKWQVACVRFMLLTVVWRSLGWTENWRVLRSLLCMSLTNKLISQANNSMEQGPSWEAKSPSDSHKTFLILQNFSGSLRVHYSSPLVPFPSHINPDNIYSQFFKVHFNTEVHLSLILLTVFFFRFLHQNPDSISNLPHTWHMPRPSRPPWCALSSHIR